MHIYTDFPFKEILYYKIGGTAKVVLTIENKEDLLQALEYVSKERVEKVLPIGLGSNVLMSDDFFDGVVLWFPKARYRLAPGKAQYPSIKLNDENLLEAFPSTSLDDLIKFSFENNLAGLEWAGGLPSSIGGAVRGNVGAFGGEIKNSVYKVEVFDLLEKGGFTQKELLSEDLDFSYRNSIIKKNKNLVIASVFFKLSHVSNDLLEKAKETYFANIAYRNKNHPNGFPSCGSVFKNITKKENVEKMLSVWEDMSELVRNKWHNKASMGYVIRRLGFAGFKIGGAEVSKKHANYIVNIGGAKFNDVYAIIEKIKEKFSQTFGFPPELEVEIVE